MKKSRFFAFFLIFTMLVISLAVLSNENFWIKKPKKTYQISVIARGKNTESWTTIWQGIEQASRDQNVDVTPVYLSKENDAAEQIAMLEREVKNGAQAIVIVPVNSTTLRKPIEKARRSVPVITVESTVKGIKDLPYVGCNNAELGKQLANEVLLGRGTKIAVLQNSLACSNIKERYDALTTTLKNGKTELIFWEVPDDASLAYESLKKLLRSTSVNKAVALDSATLEALARAEKDLSPPGVTIVDIYGIGRTRQVVSLLEEQVITEIGLPNEYNTGYLGIKSAVNELNGVHQKTDSVIGFELIPYSEMYSQENQRLLFPFVK